MAFAIYALVVVNDDVVWSRRSMMASENRNSKGTVNVWMTER